MAVFIKVNECVSGPQLLLKLLARYHSAGAGQQLVQETCPNVGDVNSTTGSQNCGWLKALKNSERNSGDEFSLGQRNGNLLVADRSKLFCAGPSKIPIPELPNPKATGSSALKRAGQQSNSC